MRLTRIQRNDLFSIITRGGLNPADFEFKNLKDAVALSHNPTEYYFIIGSGEGQSYISSSTYELIRSPGEDVYKDSNDCDEWSEAKYFFSGWVGLLKAEIEAPDLWDSYLKIDTKLEVSEIDNIPFTIDEHNTLKEKLKHLEEKVVSELELNTNQISYLNNSIDSLIDKSTKLGKKEWFIFFMGTLQALIFKFALDETKISHLASIVKEIFSGIFRLTTGG